MADDPELSELSYCCGSARQLSSLFATLAGQAASHASTLKVWSGNPVADAHAALAEQTRAAAAGLAELEGVRSKLLVWAERLFLDDVDSSTHLEDLIDRIDARAGAMHP